MRTLPTVFFTWLILVFGFSFCGGARDPSGDVNEAANESPAGNNLKLITYKYIDHQGTGLEAFSFLMPADWIVDGGIIWLLDNPGMPATAAVRVSNPTGSEEFELFPNQLFFWTTNQSLFLTFPSGSRYFGNEVRQPVNARQALREIVIGRFRSDVAGLKIINLEDVPELAALASANQQQGIQTSAEGAKVRIEYDLNGISYEEEIYAVVESYTFPIQAWGGWVYNTNWTVDYIFSFKAEKGKLEAAAKTLQTIAFSFTINPAWYNKYVQLVEKLIAQQIRQINNIGQLSRMLSQTSDQIRESSMKSYYDRQEANDRIAENFSNYIRGVDKYYDPVKQENVELPGGYSNVWTNSLGEYILSEQVDFNPNIGSNLNWQRVEPGK